MSQILKESNFLSQKDIDNIDKELLDEQSSQYQVKSESSLVDINKNEGLINNNQTKTTQNSSQKNEKRMMFLQSKDISKLDEQVYDEFEYLEDKEELINKEQNDNKMKEKLERLKEQRKAIDEKYIFNQFEQIIADIEYHKNNNLSKAIDSISFKKENVINGLIQDQDNNLPKTKQDDFRNAWIIKSIENQNGNQKDIHEDRINKNNNDYDEDNDKFIIQQGKLLKYTGGLFNSWSEIVFELYQDKLLIFKEKQINDNKIKNILTDSINFNLFKTNIEINKDSNNNDQIIIKVKNTDTVLKLKDNINNNNNQQQQQQQQQFQKLIKQLQDRIKQTQNQRKYRIQNNPTNNIVQYDTILEKEFMNNANTGDIVLFHTNNLGAQMQRATTSSKYDHVGIVIRLRDGLVRIFDAVADGVFLTEWNKFIFENGQYQFISYRKLNYHKKENYYPQLLSFVMSTIGSKYSISLAKFTKQISVIDDFAKPQKEQTYFCSELVAKCYKEMGLINQITASSQYWPRSFSSDFDDKELILYDNAKLEREQMILLDYDLTPDNSS